MSSKTHVPTENQELTADSIGQIQHWFESTVPAPTNRNAHVQLALHLTKVAAMLHAFRDPDETLPTRKPLGFTQAVLDFMQRQLTSSSIELALDEIDRLALLNALCEQIVTTTGIAHMMRMNIAGALQEIALSNGSGSGKDGKPALGKSGSLFDRRAFHTPDLTSFLDLNAEQA